jgi:hypothetical protein
MSAASSEGGETPGRRRRGGGNEGNTLPRKAAAGLPPDPDHTGKFWCGICQVSLTPKQSECHLETRRHHDNAVRHLSTAMKSTKIVKEFDGRPP